MCVKKFRPRKVKNEQSAASFEPYSFHYTTLPLPKCPDVIFLYTGFSVSERLNYEIGRNG